LKQQYKFSILFLSSTEPVIWFLTTIQNTDGTVDIGYLLQNLWQLCFPLHILCKSTAVVPSSKKYG